MSDVTDTWGMPPTTATAPGLMQITDGEFNAIRKLVYDHFGINLTERKRSLVVGRLQKLVREKNFSTFKQYHDYLVNDASESALTELANRISTNHTFFYREADHFDYFSNTVLPEITRRHKARNDRDLRIWCAAASSGEEPYTILITMMEHFGHEYSQWDVGLLATDISDKALNAARLGEYDPTRVNHVPPSIKHKYFQKTPTGQYAVTEKLKREVTIRRFNLMNQTLPFRKPFDVIFCRNVMIYFDQPTRNALVKRFYDMTQPGGYLFVGHSESLGRGDSPWTYVMPAVYRKEG